MSKIKIVGDRHRYDVLDDKCIGRRCLRVHPIQIRGATASGSRFAGYHYACAERSYNGCPQPIPAFDRELAKERRKQGMKNA